MRKYRKSEDYMRTRECLFGVETNVIVDLVQNGELVPIISKKPERVSVTHMEPVNGYFKLKGTNLVWMHVQNGYGIFINEHVETENGLCTNLVDELSQYYWYIENRTGIIKSWALDNRALYSCIESIIVYGDINKRIESYMDVHHKGKKWLNTKNTMSVVCRKKHQYHHNEKETRKSHRRGVVIRNVKEFMDRKTIIASEDVRLKNQLM